MILIFSKATGKIMSVITGFPAITETGNKAYLPSGQVLINDLTRVGWQYSDDSTTIPKDMRGRPVGVISDYPVLTLPETYDEQIVEMIDRTYPPNIATRASKIAWMKKRRRHLLRATDWCIASDSPLTTTQKTAAKDYRTALRGMGDTIAAAQVDACTTLSDLKALFPAKPAIVDTLM